MSSTYYIQSTMCNFKSTDAETLVQTISKNNGYKCGYGCGYGCSLLKQLTVSYVSFIVENGLAVTRRFDSDVFEYGQEIVASHTSYHGLLESLRTIGLRSANQSQIFVLCPRYSANINGNQPADVQVCFGGKIPNIWHDKDESKSAKLIGTFRENLRNKMRILCLREPVSMNETISIHGRYGSLPRGRGRCNIRYTKILSARASECMPIFNFDTKDAPRSHHTSNNGRIGGVIWGTFNECMKLVGSIPQPCKSSCKRKSGIYVENIDAISIVPLNKAISMAYYASRFLPGKVIGRKVFLQ